MTLLLETLNTRKHVICQQYITGLGPDYEAFEKTFDQTHDFYFSQDKLAENPSFDKVTQEAMAEELRIKTKDTSTEATLEMTMIATIAPVNIRGTTTIVGKSKQGRITLEVDHCERCNKIYHTAGNCRAGQARQKTKPAKTAEGKAKSVEKKRKLEDKEESPAGKVQWANHAYFANMALDSFDNEQAYFSTNSPTQRSEGLFTVLRNEFILDSGTNINICNDRSKFITFDSVVRSRGIGGIRGTSKTLG